MLQIRIGASLDGSVQATFKALPVLARQARTQVEAELNKMGQSPYRDAPAHAKRDLAKVVDATKDAATKGKAEFDKLGDAATKSADKAAKAWSDGVAKMARSSASNFRGIASAGVGTAGQIARGFGVHLDVAASINKSVTAEKTATDISNSAFMPGSAGAAGQRQDPRAIVAEMRGIAQETATDTNAGLEGLKEFVGKTGDLETGRAIMKDLAVLSRATGTELADMVGAAGEVAAAMGDVDGKSGKVLTVMQAIAGQGKLGAVEIRDLSKKMAGLAANAGQFAGPQEQSMAAMGALAQAARQGGGAKSAAESVTAVESFVGTFSKKARRKELKGAGVTTEDAQGNLIDPADILVNALHATHGKKEGMGKLFMDKNARKVTRKFEKLYNDAGGGAAGESAVRGEYGRLRNSSMGQGEISDSFKRSMQTTEAKAVLFQNRLDAIASSMAERVLPAFEKLAPVAISAANALAGLVSWASSNPGDALMAAIAASVTKAAFEKALTSGLGAGGLTVGAIATATLAAELVNFSANANKEKGKEGVRDEAGGAEAQLKKAEKELRETGHLSPETKAALEQAKGTLTKDVGAVGPTEEKHNIFGRVGRKIHAAVSEKEGERQGRESELRALLPTMIGELKGIKAALDADKNGVKRVEVVNQPSTSPGVDGAGRTGPG